MDLKSGYPFWAIRGGLSAPLPPLAADLDCDVAVVGGGITGALIADELGAHGHEVVVLEQRDIAWGSSSASTALLQYEIDTHMIDLAKQFGEDDALLAYRSCAESLLMLQDRARDIRDVDFAWMDSLYFASKRRHARVLEEEFALRLRHGFQVELLQSAQLESVYGIRAPAAILSHQAARVDPYRMASRLLARLRKRGGGVFDRTRVERVLPTARGINVHTAAGPVVRARHVVMAAGYASQQWLSTRVARNRSSYATITDPIDDATLGPLKHTMVWESARPYLYLRATGDGRLLVGGEDDNVDIPSRRDARVDKKARVLRKKVENLFPRLPMNPAFAWGGTFAETEDGLPFFGPHPSMDKRIHFAMAYGGNGITYSMLGAGLLRALIEKRKHADLFSFQRLER